VETCYDANAVVKKGLPRLLTVPFVIVGKDDKERPGPADESTKVREAGRYG